MNCASSVDFIPDPDFTEENPNYTKTKLDEVEILAQENGLLIMPVKVKPREQWDEQFKKAKKEGHVPDNALLEGFKNSFDKKEWTW